MRSAFERRRVIAAAIASVALAAGVILYLTVKPGIAELPRYELEVGGGDGGPGSPSNPAPSAPLLLAPGGRIEVIARPAKAISGAVGARSYFVQGETVRPWVPTIDISRDGAVRLTAGASGWSNLAPGRWELVLLVARPEDLPTDSSEARKTIASPNASRVRVLRRNVEVIR